jgi:hypothetical protein
MITQDFAVYELVASKTINFPKLFLEKSRKEDSWFFWIIKFGQKRNPSVTWGGWIGGRLPFGILQGGSPEEG